jgi:hypothetical protein
MIRTIGLAALLMFGFAVDLGAADATADAAHMFDRMRGLAGEWEGTFEWSHGRTGSGPLKTSYYITANGSALVENLVMNGTPSMTSVYHLDGSDLRMTHYCGAGTQPRFKASRIDEAAGAIDFAFVDVTNVNAKHPGYVQAAALHLIDADHVAIQFTFGSSTGVSGIEDITLKRVGSTKTSG